MKKSIKKLIALIMTISIIATFAISASADDENYVLYNGIKYETLDKAEEAVDAAKLAPAEVVYTVFGTVTMKNQTLFGGKDTTKVTFNAGDSKAALKSVGTSVAATNFKAENDACEVIFNSIEILFGVNTDYTDWTYNSDNYGGILTFNKCALNQSIKLVGANATFNECTFDNTINTIGLLKGTEYKFDRYSAWVCSGTAIFNNCTFSGTRGIKLCHGNWPGANGDMDVSVNSCKSTLTNKALLSIGETNEQTKVFFKGNTVSDTGLVLFEKKSEEHCVPLSANVTIYLQKDEIANVVAIDEDGELPNATWVSADPQIAGIDTDKIQKPNDCAITGLAEGKTLVTCTSGNDVAKFNIVVEAAKPVTSNEEKIIVEDKTPLISAPVEDNDSVIEIAPVADETPLANVVANTADANPIAAGIALVSSSALACYAVIKRKNELSK